MELNKISIIIPIYRQWHLVNKRLWEIYEHCGGWDKLEVVLVDDFSDDKQVTQGMNFWVRNGTYKHVTDYVSDENRGFGASCNKGAELSSGQLLIFHSTDVEVTGDYLSQIVGKISMNPNSLVGSRLLSHDTGWNKFGNTIYPYLEGWLLACTREVWDKLGGFDLRYGKFDYEDVDLSTTALKMGVELVPLNSPYLRHLGGMTIYSVYGVDKRREHTEKNREVFRQKWMNENE